MKIAHIHLSDEFAGSEQYAASLAAEQAKLGHTVLLVIRQNAMFARWAGEAYPAHVVALPKWVPSLLEPFALRRLLQGFGADVIHTHLGRANLKGGKTALALGTPWVATVHLRYKPKEMEKANGLICIASWQQEEVWEAGYTGKTTVIWNWLANSAMQGPLGNLRKAFNIPQDAFVFGSVGRLHRQKGMDVLIKAFRKAFFDDENVALLIAGRGEDRLMLQGLVGNDKRIMFAGYQEHMPPVYATCNVYVSASRYEPFGLTLLEAMAHKLPLICTETAGPQEFLRHEPHVAWVKPGDVDALAQTLHDIYTQAPGPTAYNMEPFQPARAVAEVLAFYETVM